MTAADTDIIVSIVNEVVDKVLPSSLKKNKYTPTYTIATDRRVYIRLIRLYNTISNRKLLKTLFFNFVPNSPYGFYYF